MSELNIYCPYCNYNFNVPCHSSCGKTDDFKVVQYTRDIGRFDPKSEEDWFNPNSWTRIGKDFLPYFNWERIGILRIVRPGINIQYKVQGCPKCKKLFDIYSNYTPDEKIESIWKHLFETNDKKEIKKYDGNSIITWFINLVRNKIKSSLASLTIIVLTILTISLIPWLCFNMGYSKFLYNPVFLYNLFQGSILSICVIVSFYYIEKYINFIKETNKFNMLFDVSDKISLIHWRNYTLCRLIGVQNDLDKPKLSQVDVVVGLISSILLLISFLFAKFSILHGSIIIAFIAVSFVIAYFVRKIKLINLKRNFSLFLKIVLPIVVGAIIYTFLILPYYPNSLWDFINSIFGLFFWWFAMFIVGTAIWMALNTTTYILQGISKLPLKISPYDNFYNASVMRKLQGYSLSLMVIVFVTIIVILSLSTFYDNFNIQQTNEFYFSNQNWINYFLLLIVGAIISSLGFGSNQSTYFYIVAFYGIVIFSIREAQISIFDIEIDAYILVIGTFFTTILVYQYFISEKIIGNILRTKKDESIQELSYQIDLYRHKLIDFDNVKGKSEDVIMNEQRKGNYLETLESLTNILKEIKDVKVRPNYWRNLVKIATPIFTSVIMNSIIKPLLSRIEF